MKTFRDKFHKFHWEQIFHVLKYSVSFFPSSFPSFIPCSWSAFFLPWDLLLHSAYQWKTVYFFSWKLCFNAKKIFSFTFCWPPFPYYLNWNLCLIIIITFSCASALIHLFLSCLLDTTLILNKPIQLYSLSESKTMNVV